MISPRDFRKLFPEFNASSWAGWNSVEDAMFGLPPDDPELVRRVTGRTVLPSEPVAEFWCIKGRGAGGSRFSARLAAYIATGREHRRVPGENIYVGVFAPDRKQAGITFRYITGLLKSVPALAKLIVAETRESLTLGNGIVIEVLTASIAAPRGRAYALVIVEEAAFLPADESANPDIEFLRAVRPALARVSGSILAVISSPYAAKGELFRADRELFGRDDEVERLVVKADTRTLNPSFSEREIERAFRDDPVAAASEYGRDGVIVFRQDVRALFTRDALDAVVVPGRFELPPTSRWRYDAFTDPSGGSADSFTLAVAHAEMRNGYPVRVIDAVREVFPPFSPEQVVRDFAQLLRTTYRVTRVGGDRYAGEWPREQFRKYGVEYVVSERTKSDIYRDALPLVNSGRVELLDHPRCFGQLLGLERRVARGGRDSIDHAPNGRDDLANAVCGALVLQPEPAKGAGAAAIMPEGAGSRWQDRYFSK